MLGVKNIADNRHNRDKSAKNRKYQSKSKTDAFTFLNGEINP